MQRAGILGADDDLRVARLLALRADPERRDLVRAALQQDHVEHPGERLRIDDVPVEVDRL